MVLMLDYYNIYYGTKKRYYSSSMHILEINKSSYCHWSIYLMEKLKNSYLKRDYLKKDKKKKKKIDFFNQLVDLLMKT